MIVLLVLRENWLALFEAGTAVESIRFRDDRLWADPVAGKLTVE